MKKLKSKTQFSFHVQLAKKAVRFLKPIFKYYFRAEVRSFKNIPKQQTILVANHDGGMLPLDALLFALHWHEYFRFSRPLYILVHDIVFNMFGPWKHILYQLGCLPADRENLDLVLDQGYDLLIYPGGARETFRSFWNRKKITLGNRTGFIRHALRKNVLLTPIVSVGVHETFFVLSQGEWIAKKLGLYKYLKADVFPLVAGFPFGIWIGAGIPQFPLPSKITMKVLPSINLARESKEKRKFDENSEEIIKLFHKVRRRMQKELTQLYSERHLPILG